MQPVVSAPPEAGRSFGLDAMRAVAILMVMVSHWANNIGFWYHVQASRKLFFAGNLGVQLFFALSGFLIGKILIEIISEAPTFRSFAIFMVRRAMRTLPLYFCWLVLIGCVWPPLHDARSVLLSFATLTQNLFKPMPPDNYFAVSWSLAVEEWFYLLFSSTLIVACRSLGSSRRALWPCLSVFLLVPLVLRLVEFDWGDATWERADEVFFRIDQIAYGVVMATMFLRQGWLFRHPWPSLVVGLALIGTSSADYWPVPLHLVPALGFNVAIIGCALCLPAAVRMQDAPQWIALPVRWMSARSYALYMVHLTVLIDVVQNGLVDPGYLSASAATLVAVTLPFAIAELSYRWLEGPMLRLRPRQSMVRAAVAQRPVVA